MTAIDPAFVRRQERNLETFVHHDFLVPKSKKLTVVSEKFGGKTYRILQQVDEKKLTFFERSYLKFFGPKTTFPSLIEFISESLPNWNPQDSKIKKKLEKQCAILKKMVKHHNLTSKSEPKVSFKNPFKKHLQLIIQYPNLLNPQERVTVVHNIGHDRLVTPQDLKGKIDQKLNQPVTILIPCRQGKDQMLHSYPLEIVPAQLFHKLVQTPALLDSGTDTITYSYDEADASVIHMHLWQKALKDGQIKT